MFKNLENLENSLGYIFKNKHLLKQALSHSSYVHNLKKVNLKNSNERLEFLGDRVLGLAVAHRLYEFFHDKEEGVLAIALAYLNSTGTLYQIAQNLNLSNYIFISGIKNKKFLKKIYANALEAILAAIYLDSTFEVVKQIIIKLWHPYIDNSLNNEIKLSFNPKSILQEWTQKNNLPLPIYELKSKGGTEHAPVFTIVLTVKGYSEVTAQANSKRLAEKIAAYNFIINNNIVNIQNFNLNNILN